MHLLFCVFGFSLFCLSVFLTSCNNGGTVTYKSSSKSASACVNKTKSTTSSGTSTTAGSTSTGSTTTGSTTAGSTTSTSGSGTTTTTKKDEHDDHDDHQHLRLTAGFGLTHDDVSYASDISAMMTKYCTSCHATGMTPPALSTYKEVAAAAARSLSSMQSGSMPPSSSNNPVSSADKEKFADWVADKMPQSASPGTSGNTSGNSTSNTTSDNTNPANTSTNNTASNNTNSNNTSNTAPKVSYEGQIKSLMSQYCVSCHSGTSKPDLNTYENAKTNAQSSLKSMQNGSMPPGKPLSATQIAQLSDWIKAGLPQNSGESASQPDCQ